MLLDSDTFEQVLPLGRDEFEIVTTREVASELEATTARPRLGAFAGGVRTRSITDQGLEAARAER